MRVLIINTSEKTGGAAVASNRLMEALNNSGVKAKMLVRDKTSANITVVGLHGRLRQQWNFLWERLHIYLCLHLHKNHLFEIDTADTGTDITKLQEFKEADIIHLEWINQGMLSLKNIQKIISSCKPVIWTMHDLWPAASICHYANGCENFKDHCHNCPLLPDEGSPKDLSYKIWEKKKKTYGTNNIHFVTCSHWLEEQAKQSSLLRGQHVTCIPNPIDTQVFKKKDKSLSRKNAGLPNDKKIILFVSQRVTDKRKGMEYFIDAVKKITCEYPDMKNDTAIAILGGHSEEIISQIPLETISLGFVNDDKRIVDIYNSANIFVLPSLEDNLPNTIMEAMACGVPCVGFNTGGIPEMIDHKENGYVAQYKNADDLAQGISWVLNESDYDSLSKHAVSKVLANYSQRTVALKYINVYTEAASHKRYK